MISSICLIHPTAPPPSAARFRRARQTVQSGVASLRNASHKGIEHNRLLFHPTNVNACNQRSRCFRTLDEILPLAWKNQINWGLRTISLHNSYNLNYYLNYFHEQVHLANFHNSEEDRKKIRGKHFKIIVLPFREPNFP